MKRLSLLFTTIFLLFSAASAVAIQEIEWGDLVPKNSPAEQGIEKLSEKEREDLEWIIYLRRNLPPITEADPAELEQYAELYEEVDEELPKLKERGFHVDRIIEERTIRNGQVNDELNGKEVRIVGHLLPLDLSGEMITDFLLVPYVGACIHTPPPPPNQIIQATLKTPIPVNYDDVFRPVVVTGTLSAEQISTNLFLVDGAADINVGYSLAATTLELHEP